jgi:hypothetical protein
MSTRGRGDDGMVVCGLAGTEAIQCFEEGAERHTAVLHGAPIDEQQGWARTVGTLTASERMAGI